MRLRASSPSLAALAVAVSVALLSAAPSTVDAARSWRDMVSDTKQGIHDSSTKGGSGPGGHTATAAAFEENPFEPFVDDEDKTEPPASASSDETFMPTATPTSSTTTPTLRPSLNPTTGEPTSRPSTLAPTDEPTLNPTDGPTDEPTLKPTGKPTNEPSPSIWGTIDEDSDCSSRRPCGPCKRCDDDDECLEGLVCHEREEDDDPVPGCLGDGGRSRFQYCVVPEGAWAAGWRNPTTSPSASPSSSPTFRPTDEPTLSPSDVPSASPTFYPTTSSPTHSPLPKATFAIGNDYGQECGSDHHEKCDRCQGPCRRDRDCHEGLKCMERGNNRRDRERPVPGCTGIPVVGVNYCYLDPEDAEEMGGWRAPTPTATPSASPSARPTISFQPTVSQQPSAHPTAQPTRQPAKVTPSFKLRLWWERGYMWQGSSRPSTWRVKRTGGRGLEITSGGGDSFVEYAGTIRPKGSFDRCWTKDGNDVIIEDCKGPVGGQMQQWIFDLGQTKKKFGGDADRDDLDKKAEKETRQSYDVLMEEEKFEIHPKTQPEKCVTNHHQPRNGEMLMIQDCVFPRGSDTSFWRLD